MSASPTMPFLDRMARLSRERCDAARAVRSEDELSAASRDLPAPKPLRLSEAGFDLIAEVKRRSPSEGSLGSDEQAAAGDPLLTRVEAYVRAGAVAISVLTEPAEFSGSLEDLTRASLHTHVPTLRKDFLVDPYQVLEARVHGASGVLIIVRMLSDRQFQDLMGMCASAQMFALVEAFDLKDLERTERLLRLAPVSPWFADQTGPALGLPGYVPCLVGLNSRDLNTLDVDTARFTELAGRFPPGFPRVAESGLRTAEDAAAVATLGYRVGLVGSALMQAADPAVLIQAMLRAARSARTGQRHVG